MKKINPTVRLVTAALLVAFTCIATMVIQIPTTATMGYIHIGDTFVILSGVILGPVLGGLVAGLGSLLADGLSGFAVFIIPTFIIKFTSAFLCGFLFIKLRKHKTIHISLSFFLAALISEINIVIGYFITSIVFIMLENSSIAKETITAGISIGVLGLFPNILQSLAGIILAFTLFPLLVKIPTIQQFLYMDTPKKNKNP